MAEDFQDRTEQPTEKKLQEGREKGRVAKSQELVSGTLLLSGMLMLFFFSATIYEKLASLMIGTFQHLQEPFDGPESVVFWLKEGVFFVASLLGPFFLGLFLVSLGINIYQVGFVLSVTSLAPNWERLNFFDISNYKKFFNIQAFARLFIGLSKLAVIGVVAYVLIFAVMPDISRLMEANARQIVAFMTWKSFWLGIVIAFFLLLVGGIDYMFQKWKFLQDMKMTRQEVKDERKQTEGDGQVKSKLRSMMHEMAIVRMKSNVPRADVVIANPTHYAIAVKYDSTKMAAPLCVAKGARKMALAIRELAEKHKIPVVENRELARPLYQAVDVGSYVPANFYHPIAEVLAYVYRLNEKIGKRALGSKLQTKKKTKKEE